MHNSELWLRTFWLKFSMFCQLSYSGQIWCAQLTRKTLLIMSSGLLLNSTKEKLQIIARNVVYVPIFHRFWYNYFLLVNKSQNCNFPTQKKKKTLFKPRFEQGFFWLKLTMFCHLSYAVLIWRTPFTERTLLLMTSGMNSFYDQTDLKSLAFRILVR